MKKYLCLLLAVMLLFTAVPAARAGSVNIFTNDDRVNTASNYDVPTPDGKGFAEYTDDWISNHFWFFEKHNDDYPVNGQDPNAPVDPKSMGFQKFLYTRGMGVAPKAKFEVQVLKPDGTIRSSDYCNSGNSISSPTPRIRAYVGDSIKLIDHSTVGTGSQLVSWDFQHVLMRVSNEPGNAFIPYVATGLDPSYWPGGTNAVSGNIIATSKSQLENYASGIKLDEPGYLQMYLSVQDNFDCGPNGSNWSTNGNYVVKGTPNGTGFPWYCWWYYTSLIVEVNGAGYKDVTVVAGGEDKHAWNGFTHCIAGKVVTEQGLVNLTEWKQDTPAPSGTALPSGPATGAGESKIYAPGDTVKLTYDIWNPGGTTVNDLPWSIGWISYDDDLTQVPTFKPLPGHDKYTIQGLEPGRDIGTQAAEFKLPDSFDGLTMTTGKTIKARLDSQKEWFNADLSKISDSDTFLTMAVMADAENALNAWPNIMGASGGLIWKDDSAEVRLQNNVMIVLVPVNGQDLMTTGMGSPTWQKEYTVEKRYSSTPDPVTGLYNRANRINILYAFWNLSAADQGDVPCKIIACKDGSETDGYTIAEGTVDMLANGKTDDTEFVVDYDKLGLGEEYTKNMQVAVILDPDNIIPESNEENNIVLFVAGDTRERLSVDVYSPPEGFPVNSTGWASIKVERLDTMATTINAELVVKKSWADEVSIPLTVPPGAALVYSANVEKYSAVAGGHPVHAYLYYNEEMVQDSDVIRFISNIIPNIPPPPEYEDDVIVDINGS